MLPAAAYAVLSAEARALPLHDLQGKVVAAAHVLGLRPWESYPKDVGEQAALAVAYRINFDLAGGPGAVVSQSRGARSVTYADPQTWGRQADIIAQRIRFAGIGGVASVR